MNLIERSARLKQIYLSNIDIGASFPEYTAWYRSIMLFHPAGPGGVAIHKNHEGNEHIWWISIYCPGQMPGIKTLRAIVRICLMAGCKMLIGNFNFERYRSRHVEIGHKLQRVLGLIGFKPLGENLLCFKMA